VQIEGDLPRARKQSGFQAAKDHEKGSDDEGPASEEGSSVEAESKGVVTLLIEVRGTRSIPKLAARLAEIPGVVSVQARDANFASE
jgi:hypothetical protein